MNKEKIVNEADITIRMFVSICKTLDDESVRYIGLFKHEQKKAFKNLLESINSFSYTIKANMQPDNIKECERIQDYLHDLVYSVIQEGVKDITVFCALCKALKTIYNKYIGTYFKSKFNDGDKFISVILAAEYFYKLHETDINIDNDMELFCTTLIEGKEYVRQLK